ncbi:MAG: nitrogen regulation protein NR(II), partial [Leptothrix sp. (in: b-proteobacteria)]
PRPPSAGFGSHAAAALPITDDDPAADTEPGSATADGRDQGLPQRAFARIFRGFVSARAVLGVLLLAMQGLITVYATHAPSIPALLVCIAYAGTALLLVLQVELQWPVRLPASPARGVPAADRALQGLGVLASVGADVLCFGLLLALTADGPLNVSALLLLPVLMAGALLPRQRALAVAAGVVLILLAGAWWRVMAGAELASQMTQAGMTGGATFAMVLLTLEMAERLARQEVTAASTLEMARQQALLNRLMIEEMQDGVMVVDRSGHVRAANPAALALIGAPSGARFAAFDLQQQPVWQPLWAALERGYASGHWPAGGEDITLRLVQGAHVEERGLRLRLRFTRRRDTRLGEALCVLFMEDMRVLRQRARQEKLAAMGRVSAGIAHEIRNPLAAISQANALLGEDLTHPAQRQLTHMVADNVERLQRIVADVLEVAPGGGSHDAPVIDLAQQVPALCADWAHTVGLALVGHSPLRIDVAPTPMPVRFDPDHLRRVLVNLLDNALRHGSHRSEALWVVAQPLGRGEVLLAVRSDGAPIAVDVEPFLFEPFFSTRSRGSGLGLYICRELCERYGAAIEYRPGDPDTRYRNEFALTLPRIAVPAAPSPAARG